MSADLFAVFGATVAEQGSHSKTSVPIAASHNLADSASRPSPFGVQAETTITQKQDAAVEDDDEGWGDFEDAPKQAPQPIVHRPSVTVDPLPSRHRILRASTMDLMTNNLVDIGDNTIPQRTNHDRQTKQAQSRVKAQKQAKDPDILFDAEDSDDGSASDADEVDDDDFGDFETGEVASQQAPTATNVDILSLDTKDDALPDLSSRNSGRRPTPGLQLANLHLGSSSPNIYPQAPKSPSVLERSPFPGLAIKTPVQSDFPASTKAPDRSPSPTTAWPEAKAEPASNRKQDDWADDDWDALEYLPAPSKSAPTGTLQNLAQPLQDVNVVGPPPTNIPPPSVLLSTFAPLLRQGEELLAAPQSTRTQLLADPAVMSFLAGYLALATVAARILAGRKQRWHRDKHLSQAMTISAAGSKSGMKLAGIDKSRTAHEEREAAELVDFWKDNIVGRLRSLVAAAAKANPSLKVPDVSMQMSVSTMKANTVPTAPKACVVCGLKRDERVKGVDFDVEDSFGDWWIDHWGHRTCRNFWLQHSNDMRSR